MTRFTLADTAAIILTDRSTGDTATTTKWEAAAVLHDWYMELADLDPVVAPEVDRVVHAIERNSDLSGSDYLGLSIRLAD